MSTRPALEPQKTRQLENDSLYPTAMNLISCGYFLVCSRGLCLKGPLQTPIRLPKQKLFLVLRSVIATLIKVYPK